MQRAPHPHEPLEPTSAGLNILPATATPPAASASVEAGLQQLLASVSSRPHVMLPRSSLAAATAAAVEAAAALAAAANCNPETEAALVQA